MRLHALIAALLCAICTLASPREFRGAWVQTIYQGYEKRTTDQNKAYLTQLLDSLEAWGFNAVIFQVRPRADAFYRSDIEPWSQYLTGQCGKAPSPMWDPLQFMVEQAHARGMELHAWLNPYRGPAIADRTPPTHLLHRQPQRFVTYGKSHYFEPSQADNRLHLCRIVADILRRYDIDGIHFDDYFYPYPIAGKDFPDAKAYAQSKSPMSRNDWRRDNVTRMIAQVADTIAAIKPWVRFGISPFGIWRNKASDPSGSETHGLQNYDDLYADVPLWAEKGLIDYQIPQLYWELDHRAAPYRTLCPWWARNQRGRHIYIGQDAENTHSKGQLAEKMSLARQCGIQGHCWWYAASLAPLAPQLKTMGYSSKALVPEYEWKGEPAPSRPTVSIHGTNVKINGAARKWALYALQSKKDLIRGNSPRLLNISYSPRFTLPGPGTYAVTALNAANGESSPAIIEL